MYTLPLRAPKRDWAIGHEMHTYTVMRYMQGISSKDGAAVSDVNSLPHSLKLPGWASGDIHRFRRSFLWRGKESDNIMGGHWLVKWKIY
jgi:hypothetical protein